MDKVAMLEMPPNDPTNPIKLADWLEISAILSLDRDASHGDLESALRVASFAEIVDGDDVERKVLDVFNELEQRENAAAQAYPFSVESGVLKLKSDWKNYPAYIFCLFLSYFGIRETRETPKLFEGISCQAAKNYIKGDAIGFGSPRRDLPTGFSDAITQLSYLLGEGGRFCGGPTLSRQDDTLDVVAWVDFIDKRPSKIILFGQCAAGENWDEKLADLQPDAFWRQWMAESLVSPTPLKSFFIPHRIDKERWNFIARKAGVMFERCRIAYWAHQGEFDFSRHIEWIQQQIVLQKT